MTATKLGVAYFGNRFVEHAKADLDRIAGCCDYVVHTVSELDLAFHKSVLSKILNESRKRGLELWVDPWGVGGVFGGEAFSKFLLEHRSAWQVMSNGRMMPAACLNRPEWRSFILEWILSVKDMGAQVLFWDEPHMSVDLSSEWEGIYSCVCDVCQTLYQRKYGVKMPPRLNEEAREFRKDTVKGFLSDAMSFTKSKGMKNAVCLYAFRGHAEYDSMWEQIAALTELDIFGCDPYWRWHFRKDAEPHVREYSRYVHDSARAQKKDSQIWIQAMRMPAKSENEIDVACQTAYREGITHLAAWSYDGGEILDTVLSEDPQAVWMAVEKAFKKIRESR